MTPWTNRAGRFSPLKTTTLVLLLLPGLVLAARWAGGSLGPRPITEAIHETGDWAIRFLLLSLSVTPLRRILKWSGLILVRRMVGLSALFYVLAHLVLYVADQKWSIGTVVAEIALRIYLTIGFVALLGLVALGSTSTDAAIRRLGRGWSRLHSIVYAIAALGILHFFMQTKADVYEATLMAGIFALLMFYRIAHAWGFSIQSSPVLAAVAVAASLATVAIEFAWYELATAIPSGRVLAANLQFAFSIRPAWWVLVIGAAVTVAAAVWSHLDAAPPHTRRPTAAAGR